MKRLLSLIPWLVALALTSGCATYVRHGLPPTEARQAEAAIVARRAAITPELQQRILALDPEHVTAQDVRDVLSNAPAPQILNIHGGIYPVHLYMISFSEFLVGMGYPEASLRIPSDGKYSFSCYESSEKMAGIAAWFYEKSALRPMLVGHSQGGMQAVKVLHQLAGHYVSHVHVWNPCTWKREQACDITDPLTGQKRPVVGLQLSYASSVGAGGFTRFLPNQWETFTLLRSIPDSVVEFTGFYCPLDLIGGDFFGFGPANLSHANGTAQVRNVRLPAGYNHVTVPNTRHLLQSQQIKDWINNYVPSDHLECDAKFDASSANILWAAEVWHQIKRHWVLELQRLIRAQRDGSAQTPRSP